MRIDISAKNIELTNPLKVYIDKKIGSLQRFVKRFDDGTLLIDVEVGRSTRHHKHGDIYYAELNLHLPGKTLRAEHDDNDVRVSINRARKILIREIRKYKTSHK